MSTTAPRNPAIASIVADVTRTERVAALVISNTYNARGRCTLSCDCGALEVYIDADAVGDYASMIEVRALLEHARFDHVSPRNILAALPPVIAYDTTTYTL